MHRIRRRSFRGRALWVALLLFALVVKPMLVLASEVHESEHLLQTGHSHQTPGENHGIPADEDAPESAGEADPWHSLMHLGHCCSHPTAAALLTPSMAFGATGVQPDTPLLLRHASARDRQVLRPPIGA